MKFRNFFRSYHWFLFVALFNFWNYNLFIGKSALKIKNGEHSDKSFYFFIAISIIIFLIWITYLFFDKRLVSARLISIHFYFVFAVTTLIPIIVLKYGNPGSTRFFEDTNSQTTQVFGNLTLPFFIVAGILVLSELLLLFNLRKAIKQDN